MSDQYSNENKIRADKVVSIENTTAECSKQPDTTLQAPSNEPQQTLEVRVAQPEQRTTALTDFGLRDAMFNSSKAQNGPRRWLNRRLPSVVTLLVGGLIGLFVGYLASQWIDRITHFEFRWGEPDPTASTAWVPLDTPEEMLTKARQRVEVDPCAVAELALRVANKRLNENRKDEARALYNEALALCTKMPNEDLYQLDSRLEEFVERFTAAAGTIDDESILYSFIDYDERKAKNHAPILGVGKIVGWFVQRHRTSDAIKLLGYVHKKRAENTSDYEELRGITDQLVELNRDIYDYPEAKKWASQSVVEAEKYFGAGDIHVALPLITVAELCHTQHEDAEADEALRHALAIALSIKKYTGREWTDIIPGKIASAYLAFNRIDRCDSVIRQFLPRVEDPTQLGLQPLVSKYEQTGDYNKAEEILKGAVRTDRTPNSCWLLLSDLYVMKAARLNSHGDIVTARRLCRESDRLCQEFWEVDSHGNDTVIQRETLKHRTLKAQYHLPW